MGGQATRTTQLSGVGITRQAVVTWGPGQAGEVPTPRSLPLTQPGALAPSLSRALLRSARALCALPSSSDLLLHA